MDYPPPMGGIQIVTKYLEEDLIRAGHDVLLVNFDGRNTNNFKRLRPVDLFFTKATHNNYFNLGNILSPKKLLIPSGYRDFVYNNLIFRITNHFRKQFKPDLTHILKPILYSAVFECSEPFIVSCHGTDIHATMPVRYSLDHAKTIHCVSNYMKELISELYIEKQKNPFVIYNPVDLNLFQQCKRPKENIIITCSRLVKRKNIDGVIRAISLIKNDLRKLFTYVIIGDGPELFPLKKLAADLKLTNILFLGELVGISKIEWLCRSKLFVLCPKFIETGFETGSEGFGIAYIEAQAAGLPVIGTNEGGIPESVGDGGLLVDDPENSEEIANNIQKLILNKELYLHLQKNALGRIHMFERKKIYGQFEQLYKITVL